MRPPIYSRLRKPRRPRQTETDDPAVLRRALDQTERQLHEATVRLRTLEARHDELRAELAALQAIGEATGTMFATEEMLSAITRIAMQLTGTESCQVYLFNETRDELVLRAARDADRSPEELQPLIGRVAMKVGEGITGWVARERKHVAISSGAMDDHRFKYVPEMREEEYQSILSVPLVDRDEVIGVINVRTRLPHAYPKQHVQLLSSIAAQVGGAIQQSRWVRKLEKTSEQLSAVAEISKSLTSNMYQEEILQLIVAMTAKTLGFKICSIMLVDEERQELAIKATQSKSRDYNKKPPLKIGESLAGRAVASGQILTCLDVRKTPEYRFPDVAEREGLVSLVCVPLLSRGKVIGVLNCYTDRARVFTEEELTLISALGNQAAIAIQNAQLLVKSAIIQEMHHRVKNSLQMVASLLRLQMRYKSDAPAEQVLTESLNRILAIASVHELLSREDLDTISLRRIADSIVHANAQSLVLPGKEIRMEVEGPEIRLDSNKATSVALILNELVQNAIEHGFAQAEKGQILVRFTDGDEQAQFSVVNDGDPLPPDFDPKRTQNLGLQIVDSLVRGDLAGKFTLRSVLAPDGALVSEALVTFPRT